MKPREEAQRILSYLRDVVEESELGKKEIAERLGLSEDQLVEILSSPSTLEYRQLIEILKVIGRTPGSFFAGLFLNAKRAAVNPASSPSDVSVN